MKIGITGFILPFAFALNPDYITFHFDIQTLMTWLSGLVVAYSLAIAFQGYVEKKITLVERAVYLGIICLVIVPNFWSSLTGIVLFAAFYGYRQWEAKKRQVPFPRPKIFKKKASFCMFKMQIM